MCGRTIPSRGQGIDLSAVTFGERGFEPPTLLSRSEESGAVPDLNDSFARYNHIHHKGSTLMKKSLLAARRGIRQLEMQAAVGAK